MTAATSKPALNWGIIGPGRIASWFASDLQLQRPDAQALHNIVAIGSSSFEKGSAFVEQHCKSQSVHPVVYDSYTALYADKNVDIVYISTPHAVHKRCTLEAIAAGKHVLCEKPMAVNAMEAEEMISAARKKGVFLMEGVWTRFFPLTQQIQKLIHDEKVIGQVARVWCDFGIKFDLTKIPPSSRMRDPNLGAGATLDIGIYSLMWGRLLLEPVSTSVSEGKIIASGVLQEGIDVSTTMILSHDGSEAQGILTCSMLARTGNVFAKVEGAKGTITISGPSAGSPERCVVKLENEEEERILENEKVGFGFYYEADAVALDITAGRTENSIMPLVETLRSMRFLDEVRRQIGLKYPQDN